MRIDITGPSRTRSLSGRDFASGRFIKVRVRPGYRCSSHLGADVATSRPATGQWNSAY
jgi:hypothetical protein